MISMQMSEDDGPHVVGADAEFEQLRADLLFRGHVERTANRKYGCQRGSNPVPLVRAVSPVSTKTMPLGRLDRPGRRWGGPRPGAVEQDVDLPEGALASTYLLVPTREVAIVQGVHLHSASPCIHFHLYTLRGPWCDIPTGRAEPLASRPEDGLSRSFALPNGSIMAARGISRSCPAARRRRGRSPSLA